MKKVLLAFADTSPENYLIKQGATHNFEVVGCCSYREEILGKVKSLSPDILILREEMAGDISIDELALTIRSDYEYCRIILLLTDYHLENRELVQTLISRGVYDIIISNDLFMSEIIALIETPKKYKDVINLQSLSVLKKNDKATEDNNINMLLKVTDKAVPVNNEEIDVGVQGAYSSLNSSGNPVYPQNTYTQQEMAQPVNPSQSVQLTQETLYQQQYYETNTDTNMETNSSPYFVNQDFYDNTSQEVSTLANTIADTYGETQTTILASQTEDYSNYPSFIFELMEDDTTQSFSLTEYGSKEINTSPHANSNNTNTNYSDNSISYRNTQTQPKIAYSERRNGRVKVYSFVGVRSGVGCTSSCLNMAKALANNGKRVLVVDSVYNYGFSDIFTGLGFNPVGNFESVLKDFASGRRGTLKMNCVTESTISYYYRDNPKQKVLLGNTTNIDYISFSSCFEDERELARCITPLIESIDNVYDYILVDVSLNCHSLYVSELLRTSNKVYLCVSHNLTSMFNAKVTLDEYKFIRGKMSVIVTNYVSGVYDYENISKYFNVNTCYVIPSDATSYAKASINNGIPLDYSKKTKNVFKKIIRDI